MKNSTDEILDKYNSPLPKRSSSNLASVYFVEILSECNLRCPLCAFGSREIFERKRGVMDLNLFEKIVKKIHSESPSATICPYHHCEPLLHPDLPEMISLIKKYGHTATIASNFNQISRIEDLVKAEPDAISVSVSGFNQNIYERHHCGGDIEKVKNNLLILKEVMNKLQIRNIKISVNYHMYKDNMEDDFDQMSNYCMQNGFSFEPSFARMINLELSLKHLRDIGAERILHKTDWLDATSTANQSFYEQSNNIFCMPEDYLNGEWANVYGDECPVNYRLINIKWDGRISRCCASFDDRNVTNLYYLESDLQELYDIKRESPMCKECVGNNYAFYMNYVGADQFNSSVIDASKHNASRNRGMFFLFDGVLDEVEEFVSNHRSVYIGGAGRYGHILYDGLKERGVIIAGFCVTEKEKIRGDEICIDDINRDGRGQSIGIVTAMDERNLSESYFKFKDSGFDILFISPGRYRNV